MIKNGACHWVRHPLYAGLISWCAGKLLLFGSFLFLILIALVVAAYFDAERKERLLSETFGKDYESCCATTGRFFPKAFTGKN